MTYRELLELYKAGELELEQRKRIEKDIEKQEAISDYLYEQEGIPGLEDVFKGEEQNSSVFADGRQTETGKEKAEADQEQRARDQRYRYRIYYNDQSFHQTGISKIRVNRSCLSVRINSICTVLLSDHSILFLL